MKSIIFTLLITLSLHAGTTYPELFSQLGTPLYKADKLFSKLPQSPNYSHLLESYHIDKTDALKLYESGNKQAYFKALRSLNQAYDNIITVLKQELHNAIKTDDYARFLGISDAGIDALYEQRSFESSTMQYYLSHKQYGESAYLNKRIQMDKGYEKQYGIDISTQNMAYRQNPLILLSTTWCRQCRYAKQYLREKGIVYTEYDAEKSQKGRELMKRYKGTGYPTFIIGNESTSGLRTKWLDERLY